MRSPGRGRGDDHLDSPHPVEGAAHLRRILSLASGPRAPAKGVDAPVLGHDEGVVAACGHAHGMGCGRQGLHLGGPRGLGHTAGKAMRPKLRGAKGVELAVVRDHEAGGVAGGDADHPPALEDTTDRFGSVHVRRVAVAEGAALAGAEGKHATVRAKREGVTAARTHLHDACLLGQGVDARRPSLASPVTVAELAVCTPPKGPDAAVQAQGETVQAARGAANDVSAAHARHAHGLAPGLQVSVAELSRARAAK
mmetsp:Transcript_27826/g.74966  ORF Transcript_27826/g.74966 Transcript_27826/m.74966 type:complete len:253 (+) Transcript_27826:543-1301(+)